jgi:hypothetical protein
VNRFLEAVERRRDAEHEAEIDTTSGARLPGSGRGDTDSMCDYADEAQALLDAGRTQGDAAGHLGISRSYLIRCLALRKGTPHAVDAWRLAR